MRAFQYSCRTGSIVCVLVATMLTACGGGSGGANTSNNGSIGGGNSGGGSPGSYTVGGTISGLSASGLVLTDNGGDSLSVPPGTTDFAFATALSSGTAYDVAVETQPSGESCSVTNGSGTINDADATNVQIACSSTANGTTASETVLYSFTGGSDGSSPLGGLIMDQTGNLYGTTSAGGADNDGTVFKVTPSGTEMVLYSFTFGYDAADPDSGLTMDSAGNLYGATTDGGGLDLGTVFKVTPSGAETVLYRFTGGSDGSEPTGGLIMDGAGNLYGTTSSDGAYKNGTVFKLASSGTESTLYAFIRGGVSGYKSGRLLMDSAGNLYGTTAYSGPYGEGTVFKLTPSGTETVLYSFMGASDGGQPQAGVVMDSAGNLYGTTSTGGAHNAGTVYELSASGTESVLYSFCTIPDGAGGCTDGDDPGPLTMDSAGNLYGMTESGGDTNGTSYVYGYGEVFKLTLSGTFTVLYRFTGGSDGGDIGNNMSTGRLVLDSAGNIYGTTNGGGAYGNGTVFKIQP